MRTQRIIEIVPYNPESPNLFTTGKALIKNNIK